VVANRCPHPSQSIHKRLFQRQVTAGGQSELALTRTDKQTSPQTNSAPKFFDEMWNSNVAARPRTVISRLVNKFEYRVESDCPRQFCPWLLCSGGNPLSSLPRTPIHKGTFQHHMTAGGQSSVWTIGQTNKEIHKQTPPQDPFSFYQMETSNVAARPRTVISRLVK
jgi:hypothetical protein